MPRVDRGPQHWPSGPRGGALLDRGDDDARIPWKERGACRDYDPDMFYPEKGGSSREAKRVCRECPVRIACLNDALRRKERYGVWGGMSERERRRLMRMADAS